MFRIGFSSPLREKSPNMEFFLVRIWTLFMQRSGKGTSTSSVQQWKRGRVKKKSMLSVKRKGKFMVLRILFLPIHVILKNYHRNNNTCFNYARGLIILLLNLTLKIVFVYHKSGKCVNTYLAGWWWQ